MPDPEQIAAASAERHAEASTAATALLARRPDLAFLTTPGTVMAELGWSA